MDHNHTEQSFQAAQLGQPSASNCVKHPELVLLTLTIPLWTFVTLYLLLVFIHYLRRIQYFTLYDKCTSKNAHFRYDFHLVVGRYSTNYNKLESHLIIDLLDNQMVSTMTVQVPGNTIFNDNQAFMYRHSRADMRCVRFSIYRRHPIKDVRCIRLAHGCSNPESRLFVYGLNLVDITNGENKFFPITSVIKYRGTQWALSSSFEPKGDSNLSKLGCSCYDPFETNCWPTYIELLILIFYIWSTIFCFGSLISVGAVLDSVTLHSLVVGSIGGLSALIVSVIYLRFIKHHIVDNHYESSLWCIILHLYLILVVGLSLAFWSLSLKQEQACGGASIAWAKSSIGSASMLTLLLVITYCVLHKRRTYYDSGALEGLENSLIKTNSRTNIEFVREAGGGCNLFTAQPSPQTILPVVNKKTTKSTRPTGSGPKKHSDTKRSSLNNKGTKASSKQKAENKNREETLDNAFNSENSTYIKTKNRNSISQYI